jgi:Domain of unknown function (DUF6504)
MNRVYGEPVSVRARADGRPLRFVWRSRLYTVRAILEHWVINREWWRDPGDAGEPREAGDAGEPREAGDAGGPREAGDAGEPTEPGAPAAEPGRPELEFWRVEAAPGPGMPPGVYELRRDAATGAWTLRLN